jgi:hypothetical protein
MASSSQAAIWDVLVELFGEPRMPHLRTFRGKMVRDYAEAGYSPDELRRAAREYRREWPKVSLTAPALYKWVDEFSAKSKPEPRVAAVVEPEVELVGPPPGWSLPRLKEI